MFFCLTFSRALCIMKKMKYIYSGLFYLIFAFIFYK